jgi:hypothetical protein
VRAAFALAFVLLLTACESIGPTHRHRGPPAGWQIKSDVDPISGRATPTASLWTEEVMFANPRHEAPAVLQLMCLDGRPVARLAFHLRVGAERNSTFAYRFDQRPGHESTATFQSDNKTVVIDDRAEMKRFMDELATSNILFVRARSPVRGDTTAEFRVSGAPAAIQAVMTACKPAPSDQRKRRRA